ncbi:hypothetical protein SLA2020_418440 [Shorea laevis]
MKISSKSILSPGRSREPSQISLSSSLSRRLRSNGSIKGGQASPMFPAIGKKRGCALENPEPSSPKVTCIGQVRVKTKKQGKKIRARSKRRGEVSFRKMDHNSNGGATAMAASPSTSSLDMCSHQDYNRGHFLHSSSHHHQQSQQQECRKWVHFPVTICEALRAFGAELNCLLPCRSSCMANQREKVEKAAGSDEESNRSGNGSSCGAVFARWLLAVQEGEGKERNIEVVVGEEDRRVSTEMRSSRRRHIFEDIEINEFKDEKMGEEEARVSICIPPQNALLLMRCRSDPVKMAALANRFWELPAPQDEEEEVIDEDGEKVEEAHSTVDEDETEHEMGELRRKSLSSAAAEEQEIAAAEAEVEPETESVLDGEEAEEQENQERNPLIDHLEEKRNIEYQENQENEKENQPESSGESSSEIFGDPEKVECEENAPISPENEDSSEEETDPEAESENSREDIDETISNEQERSENEEKAVEAQAIAEETEEEETGACERSEPAFQDSQERAGVGSNEKESQPKLLPDCLLLMMCEPKLSMEVSKETWVCSTDFIRWLPERLPPQPPVNKKKDRSGDEPKRRISIDSKPSKQLLQPRRSSCSFPVAPPTAALAAAAQASGGASMATMIEQKLVGGRGYEPFVLTRCKSEPMRSTAKVAPDGCFWKNGKLEPAKLGVGEAGVGF